MANPPKKPSGTTPPRRKAASRKATPPAAQPPKSEGDEVTSDAAEATPPKAPAKRASRTKASTGAAAPAKPRAAKRPPAPRAEAPRRRVAESAPAKLVSDTRERMGDRNFFAAVLGATAALGAALAGVFLATRSRSESADESKPNAGAGAHQADGTDSSAQFEAGIADEGMIPDKLPDA